MSDENAARDVSLAILKEGAVVVSPETPFTWASGYKMPIYIDNRCLISSPKARAAIKNAFLAAIATNGAQYDAVAGVATGAIPHATTLADALGLPLLYVRPKPKDHGAGRQVEGGLPGSISGKKVLLIEDTISTGGSAVGAIDALRKEGAIVDDVRVIFHYAFPGIVSKIEEMANPPKLIPLLTFTDLLDTADKASIWDPNTLELLKKWHSDPFSWGAANGHPK